MNELKKIGGGLQKLPKDKNDFSMGAFFKTKVIPTWDFIVGTSEILDQVETDFCTGFATSAASSVQEGVTLNPFWSFAKSKELSGDIEAWGQNLRTACKVHQKTGAPDYDREYSLEKRDAAFLRDIKNYPEDFLNKALVHKKQAYFEADFFKSTYDSIAAALWKFKDEKRVVITGALWRSHWTFAEGGIIPGFGGKDGFGHAFVFVGQKYIKDKPYLIAQLSNGEDIGDKGFFYFSKFVVDREFTFGNFMFLDMPAGRTPEDISKKTRWSRTGFWRKLFFFV